MNIIIVGRRHGQSKTLALGALSRIALIGLCIAIPVVIGVGAYYITRSNHEPVFNDNQIDAWNGHLSEQKAELENLKVSTQDQLKALTLRLADLQARLTRLDALGERLRDTANLDVSEFDFSMAPAVGGPNSQDLGDAYRAPSIENALGELADRVSDREQQLDVLERLIGSQKMQKEAFLAGRPIKKGWMSSRYGGRTDPFTGRLSWHSGVDFAAKDGSDIIAVAAGVVVWASNRSGYGRLVEINHGNGFKTRYAHCKAFNVKVGDVVTKGQVVAFIGSSGRSTGPHVHFEVWKDNKSVNPAQYIHRAGL